MNILKKSLSLIIVSIFLLQSIENTTYASPTLNATTPIKAAVFLNNFNDLFIDDAKKALENVQREHENKVEFTFFDSKGNQLIENENIDIAISDKYDFFVVNPVTTKKEEIEDTLNKIIHKNIPLILYLSSEPSLIKIIKSAPRAVIVTGDAEQAGSLQGKILADIWKSNTATIDRNKDNILQYSMLQGSLNNASTILRSKNSIKSINSEGIKTNELSSTVCNWNKECAKINIETSFITLGNKIEAIISNNDEMAIGAIEALQKYGFNKNDKLKYIPIVGIGGLGKAKELIDQGIMAGTVIEDLTAQANAIYNVGMNLVSGKYSLDGTNLKFDETGMTIKIPYYKYVKQ